MQSAVKKRVEKIEQRISEKERNTPLTVFGETGRGYDEIIGITGGNGIIIKRKNGENVSSLIKRARQKMHRNVFSLVYIKKDFSSDISVFLNTTIEGF